MHPERGIVRTYRRLDGLSTRPDDQNTLTCQSADTNYAPRGPLHGPVTTTVIQIVLYLCQFTTLSLAVVMRR